MTPFDFLAQSVLAAFLQGSGLCLSYLVFKKLIRKP